MKHQRSVLQPLNIRMYNMNTACTWERAAQHLGSQAHVALRPVLVPGLRVDPDVPGHSGRVEQGEDGGLQVLVPLEHLNHRETQGNIYFCIHL